MNCYRTINLSGWQKVSLSEEMLGLLQLLERFPCGVSPSRESICAPSVYNRSSRARTRKFCVLVKNIDTPLLGERSILNKFLP